jgi:hypothetical protein
MQAIQTKLIVLPLAEAQISILTKTRQFRKPSLTVCSATVAMIDELCVAYELSDVFPPRKGTYLSGS